MLFRSSQLDGTKVLPNLRSRLQQIKKLEILTAGEMTSPVFLFLVYITDKARKIIKMNLPELDVCVGESLKKKNNIFRLTI